MFRKLAVLLLPFFLVGCSGGGSNAVFDDSSSLALASIEISPAEVSIKAGETQTYTATGFYNDGTQSDITGSVVWQSSDVLIAEIDETGLAQSLEAGITNITAGQNGVSASAELMVVSAVTRFEVYPPAARLSVGSTKDYRAIAHYSDGSTRNVTFEADWSLERTPPIIEPFTDVSKESGKDIDRNGTAIAIAVGEDTLTATFEGAEATTLVKVGEAKLLSITVSPFNESIPVGAKLNYVATGIYSDGISKALTKTVEWVSSEPSIASISNVDILAGEASGLSEGLVEITATQEGITGSTSLRVSGDPIVQLDVFPPSARVPVGSSQQYEAVAYHASGESEDVTDTATWISTNSDAATIGAGGLAKAMSVGTSTIRAEFGAAIGAAQFDVVEAQLTDIVIEPAYSLLFPVQVERYEAIAYYEDGTSRNVTNDVIWSSGDTEIFQISNSPFFGLGLGMGLSLGDTEIFAELPGSAAKGRAEVSVVAGGISIQKLEISPPNATIIQDDTQKYEAHLLFEGGAKVKVTGLVSWASSDNTIAVINEQGLAHGEAAGSVDIQARFSRLSIDVVSTAVLTVEEGVTIEAVVVSPPAREVITGDTQQFEAVALLGNGGSILITNDADWSTSDSSVASIKPKGLAHGESEGTVQVAATFFHQGVLYQGNASLTVLPKVVIEEIVVSPPIGEVLVGRQLQYYATARLSDGRDVDVTTDVSWQTSDARIAQIKPGGLATGVLNGEVSVVATLFYEGINYAGDARLKVSDASIDVSIRNIEITPHQAYLLEGKSAQLKAVAVLTDLSVVDITNEANWFSQSTMTATVESGGRAGLVTGVTEGSTLVYVEFSYDGVTYPCLGEANCEVSIFVEAPAVLEIQVIPATSEVITGNDQPYQAFARLSNGESVEVTSSVVWRSNDADIASISQGGLATGLAEGDTQIQATLNDQGTTFDGFAQLKVLPIAITIDDIVVTPADEKILVNDQLQYRATAILSDGRSVDITDRSSWSTAPVGIAHIDTIGLAVGLVDGSTVVEAAVNYEGVRYAGSTTLQVDEGLNVDYIQITPRHIALSTGATGQYQATAVMSDLSTRDVTREAYWSTKDPSIAVVNQGRSGGLTTGITEGETFVYAEYTYNGVLVPCIGIAPCQATVDVVDPGQLQIEGLQITPVNSEILIGGLQQFKAEAIFADGHVQEVTNSSTWSSSDNTVAQLQEPNGLFVGTAEGSADIVAQYVSGDSNVSDKTTLSVRPVEVTVEQLVIEPAFTEQLAGHSGFYSATAILSDSTDIDATNSVVWTSSDTQVAAIDPSTGEATTRMKGSTTIEALLNYENKSISDNADLIVKMPVPVSLSVLPSAEVQPAGGSVQYTASLIYDDGSSEIVTRNVTWTSGDDEIAFVSNATGSKGLASALSLGITSISANHESGLNGQASLDVRAAELSFLEVEPASVSLDVNTTVNLTALAHFTDNTVLDVTLDTNWSSDDAAIASVGNSESAGIVGANSAGATEIQALYNGMQVSVPTEVNELAIVSSRIEPQDLTLPRAVTQQYRAIVDYSDGSSKDVTDNVTWVSSDTMIASISNVSRGLATTASAGTTQISASFDGAAVGSTSLTVTQPELTTIDVDPASISVQPGEPIYYTATGNYSDGSSADITFDVTWVSKNAQIVAIDNYTSVNMVALALQNGQATIAATLGLEEGSGTVEVATEDCGNGKPESILILDNKTLQVGQQVQFSAIGVYKNGCTQDLTDRSNVKFASDDDDVCDIDNKSGVATGISIGVATITASWGNGGQLTEGFGTCTVVE